MNKLIKIIEIELKLFIRQKESVFYTFTFPFICLVLFIGIWGRFPGYVNTLTSGLAAMISLNIAIFGTGLVLSFYRRYGFYKRLTISPIKEIIYVCALIISRFVILIVVVNLFLLFAHVIYSFQPKGSIFDINLMLLIGSVSLTSLAVFIVSLGNNQGQIIQAANLLFFPMLFLGGTFYSLDHLPKFLKIFAHIFPYTYLIKGLTNITIKGMYFYQNIWEIIVLLTWFFICLILAIERFKSEEVL